MKLFRISFTLITLCFLGLSANAVTITVTNDSDDGPGSFRQAIRDAELTVVEDKIVFDPKIFGTPKTITLMTGQIQVSYPLIIEGPGQGLLTISGNDQSRIFFSNLGNYTLTIRNLTLAHGFSQSGGAIRSSMSLVISNVTFRDCLAAGSEVAPAGYESGMGGAIYASGGMVISDSLFEDNRATGIVRTSTNPNFGDNGTAGSGGAIYFLGAPKGTVVNTIFQGNVAQGASSPDATSTQTGGSGGAGYGGAIFAQTQIELINSNFINNAAIGGNGAFGAIGGSGGGALGGGTYASTVSRILNCFFIANSASSGNGGSSTNPNNAGSGGSAFGGGVYDGVDAKYANLTLVNNLVRAGTGRIGGDAQGGGLFLNSRGWMVVNATITDNSVSAGIGTQSNGVASGGGIRSRLPEPPTVPTFRNNIVANNAADSGPDLSGDFGPGTNNLIRNGENGTGISNGSNGNIIGTGALPIDPMLGPIAGNGGLTRTRPLLSGSPAINAGTSAIVNPITSQPLLYDQRGYLWVGVPDIGAFEYNAYSLSQTLSPDLQDASDTGLLNTDNITNASLVAFDVRNALPGATVELVKNGQPVATVTAASFNVVLTDAQPPADGVVQYSSRQTINGVTSGASAPISITFDNTAPTLTLEQASNQPDPSPTDPIRFTVVFSEPVNGFDSADISLAGSTADLSAAAKWVLFNGGSTYTIEISGLRSPGLIVVSIPAHAAYDRVINYNETPAVSNDNSVTFQPTKISVTVAGRVRRSSGRTLTPSTITLTDSFTGETFTDQTNPFGYFRFAQLPTYQTVGRRFTVTISNKRFNYSHSQILFVGGNVTNLLYTTP